VVAFLRGSTNPPPENWVHSSGNLEKAGRQEELSHRPQDAQQSPHIFLAAETGGDFITLRSAVRDKPGVFVRASQI